MKTAQEWFDSIKESSGPALEPFKTLAVIKVEEIAKIQGDAFESGRQAGIREEAKKHEPLVVIRNFSEDCKECVRLCWPQNKQPRYLLEGEVLCWTHASAKRLKPLMEIPK